MPTSSSRPTASDDLADEIVISEIRPSDAGEVLTVQRAAFVSEALIYASADMPPLVQTLEELEAELATADGWVARVAGRLVGAIRTREVDDVLLIDPPVPLPAVEGLSPLRVTPYAVVYRIQPRS